MTDRAPRTPASARRRYPPLPLRALRSVAALSVLGLAGIMGYQALRAAGFKFLWEVDRELLPPPIETGLDRPVRRVREAPAERAPGAVTAPDSGALPPAVVTTSVSPPEVDAGAPVGRGAYATIDFERLPDGRPVCSPCPVSDEWAEAGLRLSFRSWSADSRRPHVLDARNFLPADAGRYALGPSFADARGLEVGVIRLDFPGRPRKVAFTLYGPDLIPRFDVSAWTGSELLPASAIERAILERYRPAGRAEFRAERILVESGRGIDRISLDGWGPPGHVLIVDDLAIDP